MDKISYKCKIGKMTNKGKILWLPKRFAEEFREQELVEITIRKLK